MSRFELAVDGTTAFLDYKRRHDLIWLVHTEVPESLRGHGVATRLIHSVLERVKAEKLRVIATCPTVQDYLRRHPEYQAILARPIPDE